jgi:hypothetical protein
LVSRGVVEIDQHRVRARLRRGDLGLERLARELEIGELDVEVAVLADERAELRVVAFDLLHELGPDRLHPGERLLARGLATRGIRRDDQHQHGVLRGHPLREPLGVLHARRVGREQVGEVGAQRQVEHGQVRRQPDGQACSHRDPSRPSA